MIHPVLKRLCTCNLHPAQVPLFPKDGKILPSGGGFE